MQRFLCACLLSTGLWLSTASASVIEGVRFADRVTVQDASLRLYGVGLLRYRIVIKAYVGALYLGESVRGAQVLSDVPKRLELEYFWSIPAEDFGRAAWAILRDNFPPDELKPLEERIERINRWYVDVNPGDRYSLTYVPGWGTELAHNGQPLGRIEGDDFARIYYAIWLGERPANKSFRDQLISGRK